MEKTVPNNSPSQEQRDRHDTEFERALMQPSYSVEVTNWRELGLAIASYNKAIGNYAFLGTVEQVTGDGMTRLSVELVWMHHDIYRCDICGEIPEPHSSSNPGICAGCGQKVCNGCREKHDLVHWRPAKETTDDAIPF